MTGVEKHLASETAGSATTRGEVMEVTGGIDCGDPEGRWRLGSLTSSRSRDERAVSWVPSFIDFSFLPRARYRRNGSIVARSRGARDIGTAESRSFLDRVVSI